MPYTKEPIAVIGSGCRFPGESSTPSKLWDLLKDPRDVLRPIDRFRADNFYNKDGHYHGASNVLSAYLLSEDTKKFDAQFFNIPLSEAEAIDPQQRLLMETVYESLESAGQGIERLSGSNTAVYVGVMCDDFSQIVYGDSENVPTYAATGSARSILSNRISYFFNWHGPSMTIDTACSSSLIAVHQAVQVLRSGEAPVAIAAGTNLIFGPTMFVAESNLNMLSATGRSRMWDAGANGYARGEGVGSVVMKTLSAALRDGDHIEYIIRETGINQDGKTPGITMPSSSMQASLIRDTYARAGLDLSKRSDRCQYFEAHGTGTPAGDPQEAGAIYEAFFTGRETADDDGSEGQEDILYVGSVKTIIGHTEGTAGIAGLMKAALAIQNKAIPPNMHFQKLNPDLKPYYNNLKVPIQLRDWPEVPAGVPLRASVNSFGFGGANAHAVIEGYEPEIHAPQAISLRAQIHGTESKSSAPMSRVFVFSANSAKSLAAQLSSYISFIEGNPDFSMDTLSWSLFRRTAHNFRLSFAADSLNSLITQIKRSLGEADSKKTPLGVRAGSKASRDLLGIFTGQGAQWATMGRDLILSSRFAESIIDDLEKSLTDLPEGDVPDWSLKAEMLASKDMSRIAEGVISQPLCTAVQIMLVQLLKKAGISFKAVVGHSSGEIACAYVSGFLSARDAIRVAYYRGKFTPLAKVRPGAMIAVGTDMEDAVDLCSLPKLRNRAQLAASNSSASVTISGDADAIDLVEIIAKDEAKFARKLKVDTAYHSFHMAACTDPYIEALKRCGIEIQEPDADACAWFTSVEETNHQVTTDMATALKGQYWCDNMLHPVLFSQAVTAALCEMGQPGVALEVGPHPALKGPASLTIEETVGQVPYFGTLSRGQDDALAFMTAVGSIWCVLGASAIPDMRQLQQAFVKDAQFKISKELPSYAWDHDRVVWSETRVSRSHRLRTSAKHELLGIREVDEGEGERRWRNYLKPKEMPWLRGHQIQGQMVFPAAGFAVMALEAARTLVPDKNIRLMQLSNFSIHKALSFMDDAANIETLFALSNIRQQSTDGDEQSSLTADFTCYACVNKDLGTFASMAGGQVKLTLGKQSEDGVMPERPRWINNFVNTDVNYFYECLAELGYGYQGMFQGVTDLQRTNGGSKGIITIPQDDGEDESMQQNWVIHPATLDVAFQAVFAAVGAPGDGRLWTLHVPTMIDSITINPAAINLSTSGGVTAPLPFDALVVESADQHDGIAGDIDLYDEENRHVICQIQGLHVTPLTKASASDDRDTFASITWGLASPDLVSNWTEWPIAEDDERIASFAERLSLYILRELCESVSTDDVEHSGSAHQRAIIEFAQLVLQKTAAKEHPTCRKEWLADTWDVLKAPAQRLAKTNVQIERCLSIRAYLIPYMGNELSGEKLKELSMISANFYATLSGYQTYINRLGELVEQLSFKHRNMRVLEIGAGRGDCTKLMLKILGLNVASYTITDADETHFDILRSSVPALQTERVTLKTLDIEKSPAEQDFVAGHYDLIIVSNALHAAADLEETLRQVRSLVRPGGYLALLEPTRNTSLAIALGGCVLPEWFSGIEEERKFSPFANHEQWDDYLRAAGFSGLDTATPEERTFTVPFSVMCSMAVDKQMEIIRDPLGQVDKKKIHEVPLLIMGGRTVHTRNLVRGLRRTLAPFFNEVLQIESVTDITDELLDRKPATISLLELDEPLFKPFTEEKFKAIVRICDNLQTMLWITIGCRGENPYMNMMVAVGRCLVGEMPNLRLQFLNFDGSDRPTPNVVAHHLLRIYLTTPLSGEPRKPSEPLYLIERELTIQNNTLLVPRYLPVDTINARLNSDRRHITYDVDQSRTLVTVDASSSQYKLLEGAPPTSGAADAVKVSVSKSLLNSVRVGTAGCLYVVLGVTQDNKQVIALSEANQSVVWVPRSQLVQLERDDISSDAAASLLSSTAANLLAMALLANVTGAVLVHEAPVALARSLQSLAAANGNTIVLTSASIDASSSASEGTVAIHPSCPSRELTRIIPKNVAVYADFSNESSSSKSIASRIEKLIPQSCDIKKAEYLYSPKAFRNDAGDQGIARDLGLAVRRATVSQLQIPTIVSVSVLTSQAQHGAAECLQVIDWRADATLPITIRPAGEAIRFRSDRTYFLIGLAGELGLQLTKWMVKHGAKYLALASRSPQVNPEWLELMESEGAIVKMYAMDVTTRSSVKKAHKKICTEMPPVAGVMNGAMILIDGLFANKTHAEFEKTLRPKVDGTVYLDEVFSTTDLDFFVVFSSLASVSGNMGQTAYAAANAFMCSLIAGRRMRGLAGSAINMPGIVGLGYLNRDARKLDRLKNLGYVNISEWDFYQFLSEAIRAGHPNSGMNAEITAGLKRLQVDGNPDAPLWSKTPRFHWLRIVDTANSGGAADGDGKEGSSSVRSKLAGITNEGDLRNLLLDGLLDTLYSRLNLNPDEQGITPDTAIVELGVDSLLAVDMRSWFTKELDLDMPVLKILGGATVYDLVDDAMKRLAPALVPNLIGSATDSDADAAKEGATTKPVDVEPEAKAEDEVEEEAESDEEEPKTVIAPLDLPAFDDEEEYSEDLMDVLDDISAGSTSAGEDSEDDESEETRPTTTSDSASDYVKVEVELEKDSSKELAVAESGEKPVAKLFSGIPDTALQRFRPKFVKKVPMPHGASRFWFLMQYLRDPTTFNLVCRIKLTGDIRMEDADRCMIELGNRHEVFHSCFFADPARMNEPTMGVLEETRLRLERRIAATEGDVDAEADELLSHEFKIEQGETVRVKLVTLPDSTHHLLFGFHHIIMDGFSFNILMTELNPLYDNEPLPPVKTPFSDFAVLQRKQVTDGSLEGDFQFWKSIYSTKMPSGQVMPDFPEPLPLFSLAQSPRQSLDNYEYQESSIVLDTRTIRQIKAQCRRHKITPFHFFLGVYRTFLTRHLNLDDLVIGVADANRINNSLDSTVGFMLNLLPLRFKKSEETKQAERFKDVALNTRDTVYEALAHSKLPFDALLERLNIPRSATHSPLFQAWMDYRPFNPNNRPTLFGSDASGEQTLGRNGYDLTLDITEIDGADTRLSFRTQKYLYSAESTQTLFESYLKLVKAFGASFDVQVESVSLWNSKDIEIAKSLGRGPEMKSEWPETVSHRIGQVASQNPTTEAVKDDTGRSLSYAQLQNRMQLISNRLIETGVKQGSRVAVFQEASADWVCSLLAIWHAGGTYVPMDFRSSESLNRLATISRAATLTAIICHDATAAQLPELKSTVPAVNVSLLNDEDQPITITRAKANTPAAVLFTSGSTGTPKGVILTHRAFQNTMEGLTRQYGIGAEKVLQQSAFTFDFSLDQIICGLVNAGTVYVVSKEKRSDPTAIAQIIEAEDITYTRATPSEYSAWFSHGGESLARASHWKFAWGGGEALSHALVQRFAQLGHPELKLYNSYGPAESITCTKIEIPLNNDVVDVDDDVDDDVDIDVDVDDEEQDESQKLIPIGFPLPNYSVYIVDHNLELVPQGVAGEMVIGGPSVGAGYLNDEKFSESKFISNAYSSSNSTTDRIVYRTGDVGRFRTDGSLVFLGRMAGDTMIKLRGMRADLLEIENSILSAAAGVLEKVVVTLRKGDILVAHVQFAGEEGYQKETFQKSFVRELRYILPLPNYMVPAVFIPVADMPTNAHGKTDRKAVAAMALPQVNNSGRTGESLTETERKLLDVWMKVISEEDNGNDVAGAIEVSDHTSFFEMGGNSLLLVKLQMLVNIRFSANISLLDLFGAASLGAMATKIELAPPADVIDWEEETGLEMEDFEEELKKQITPVPSGSGCLNVLVTGSTGFLGRHLMESLTASHEVGEIHCVAVRSTNDNKRKNAKSNTTSKVKTYAGDLAAPFLGLSEPDFAALSSKIDVIVHAGASRTLVDAYPLLRGTNFESTKSLVRLAAPRRIPFHFISSGSVQTLDGDNSAPPTSGSDGYVASKWASERYLRHASTHLQLPVTVHRIIGSQQHDDSKEIAEHIRTLSSRMKLAPTAEGTGSDIPLDFIRVNSFARDVVTTLTQPRDSTSPSQVRRLEYCANIQASMEDLAPADTGLKTIPAMQWIARARASGFEWQVASRDNFPLDFGR